MVRCIFGFAAIIGAASLVIAASDLPAFIAPGRADRTLQKRAPQDFGTFTPDCAKSPEACNNACYYINCQAPAKKASNPDRITYTGVNSKDNEKNRVESGCKVGTPNGNSICREFPFSQKFASDPHARDFECDEWPPAASQQDVFSKKVAPNSLRCIPGPDNGSLGSQIGKFFKKQKGPVPGRKGTAAMARDDFFTVKFTKNIGNSPFCKPNPNCDNDGFQFGMTAKAVSGGKISSPYNNPVRQGTAGNDNRYALQRSLLKDLFQCSITFERIGDPKIDKVVLSNFQNKDIPAPGCTINKDGDVCTFKGLPNDIMVTRKGALGKPFAFEYANTNNVNHFAWNSDSVGQGRGPATDDGKSSQWCKVTKKGTVETTECWFPCYEKADGK